LPNPMDKIWLSDNQARNKLKLFLMDSDRIGGKGNGGECHKVKL
jgi:hypothetical protein